MSVCLSVYNFIDSSCQNTDFHLPMYSIQGKIAACTQHNCCCNMLANILLKNPFKFIVLVTSVRIKQQPPIFLFRFSPIGYIYVCHAVRRLTALFIV